MRILKQYYPLERILEKIATLGDFEKFRENF